MFMYIVTIISLLLDLFLSTILPIVNTSNNFFIPMFTIVSLVLMYPYFNHKQNNYIRYAIIIGFIYDILITNTLLVNATIFACLAAFIRFLDSGLSNNLLSIIIKSLLVIFVYDVVMYLILSLIGYINFNIFDILFKLLKSISLNLIYIIVCYSITNRIAKRLKIKKFI